MNILILNRHPDQSLSNTYAQILESEKHSVENECELRDIAEYGKNPHYLSQFDFILAHPTAEDTRAINAELLRRESLRVVIFNVEGKDEMNGRLRYSTPLSRKDLVELTKI